MHTDANLRGSCVDHQCEDERSAACRDVVMELTVGTESAASSCTAEWAAAAPRTVQSLGTRLCGSASHSPAYLKENNHMCDSGPQNQRVNFSKLRRCNRLYISYAISWMCIAWYPVVADRLLYYFHLYFVSYPYDL